MKHNILRVARKEWASLFGSPTAYIFLGSFLAVTLFAFFWVDTFFARNLADIRPLFEWMPVLLIFLMSAVTMRMWSEERRMGTLGISPDLAGQNVFLGVGEVFGVLGFGDHRLGAHAPASDHRFFYGAIGLGPGDWGLYGRRVFGRRLRGGGALYFQQNR
jgi:ABC-2 type transport system permease protein